MSLRGGASAALDQAVRDASATVKFALAAGNDSANANNTSPARTNGGNIYTVSAIDQFDIFASFSDVGNPPVDFAAPGVELASLQVGDGTVVYSRTPMATPHGAGILLCGNIRSNGSAVNDPDGNPGPIPHR